MYESQVVLTGQCELLLPTTLTLAQDTFIIASLTSFSLQVNFGYSDLLVRIRTSD
jgi:hypothetical protein